MSRRPIKQQPPVSREGRGGLQCATRQRSGRRTGDVDWGGRGVSVRSLMTQSDSQPAPSLVPTAVFRAAYARADRIRSASAGLLGAAGGSWPTRPAAMSRAGTSKRPTPDSCDPSLTLRHDPCAGRSTTLGSPTRPAYPSAPHPAVPARPPYLESSNGRQHP